MTTLQRVRETVSRHDLVRDQDAVLIALSGGPDSVALIQIMSRLKRTLHLRLGAVYVNHQIRPRAARKEERFCQQLCASLRIPLTVVREDVPAQALRLRLGLEEAAREVRYAVFDRLASEGGYDRVALGHQADDQVETILFRLMRGTGPAGLVGIPIKRGKYIRPLLDLTRADILEYLRRSNVVWCDDTSNRAVKFRRNWIRNRLLPLLRKNLNPQVDHAVLSLAETVAEEETILEAIVAGAIKGCVRTSPGGKFELALTKFSGYASGIRRRLLRYCLKASCPGGYSPGKEVIQRLDRLAQAGTGSLSLPGGVRAVIVAERLFIWRPCGREVREAFVPGRATVPDWPAVRFTGRVTPRRRAAVKAVPSARRVCLDWDTLQPPLEVRSLKPGDRFRPLGLTGHKKIRDYLSDRKVPRPLRDEVLVLCDQQGPIWLVGHEIAERAKVDHKTRRVLTLAVSIRKEKSRAAL